MKRVALVALALLAGCGGGGGGGTAGGPPPVQSPTPGPGPGPPSLADVLRISADPFTNDSSQHATEVEPSAFARGNTIVAAFQAGRFFTYGSSDIAFATSFDGGVTWQNGTLPRTTKYASPAGIFDSISDPSVAYDARHATWLVGGLPIINNNGPTPGAVVATSIDALHWSSPIGVTPADETTNDKDWVVCDNHTSSPFYGRCYIEWDSFAGNGKIFMSRSSDGGQTWSTPASPTSAIGGIGGQPLVQPDGTVIVPIDDIFGQSVLAFRSRDGGTTWSTPVRVSTIADHSPAGPIRSLPLVSAAMDDSGKVYAVWQDCRFRANCAANDLVMSASSDGVSWTSPARIPIDGTSSGVDHFIPGVGIAPGTGGGSAHIGITYYSYANASCDASTCSLFANFIASNDGGATWGAAKALAGPMVLSSLAHTIDGAMVGDYMATVFGATHPVSFVAVANPVNGSIFDEGLYVSKAGAITTQSLVRRSSIGERPVPGFHSDHPPRRLHP